MKTNDDALTREDAIALVQLYDAILAAITAALRGDIVSDGNARYWCVREVIRLRAEREAAR